MNRRSVQQLITAAGASAVLVGFALLAGCNTRPEQPTAPLEPKGGAEATIGSHQNAIRNECWYALNRNWLNKGDDAKGPGGDGSMSNWNYLSLAADANANGLKFALNTLQGCVSNLIPCSCCKIGTFFKKPKNTVDYWAKQLSSDDYGLRYGKHTGVGHGCQCVSFASMVLYRATGGKYKLSWNWDSIKKRNDPSAMNAQPGDLVYKTSGVAHVAVCVRNYGTGITLVDSNWVGGNGGEVIGRHDLTKDAVGKTWKTFRISW